MGRRPAFDLKIAYIGGGSSQWARKLMADLALRDDMGGTVRLYDIDHAAALLNEAVGGRMAAAASSEPRWRFSAEASLARCLEGADIVVVSIQPGSLELMGEELEACARRGLHYPVGDSVGAPGIARGLRTAAYMAGFAREIMARCPEAWVVNYTNPLAVSVLALHAAAPGIKALGCCHEVAHVRDLLAAGAYAGGGAAGRGAADPRSLRLNVLGVNHFAWIDAARSGGADLLEEARRRAREGGPPPPYRPEEVDAWADPFRSGDRLKLSLLAEYGLLPAAGDRHLAEFLPGICTSVGRLKAWGIAPTKASFRIARREAMNAEAAAIAEGRKTPVLAPSGEEGVAIMRGLLGLGDFLACADLPNVGQVANLPAGCVVETMVLFSEDAATPLSAGSLPAPVLSLVRPHAEAQAAVAEAALAGDRGAAFPAFHSDPSVGLPLDEARSLFDELCAIGDREFEAARRGLVP